MKVSKAYLTDSSNQGRELKTRPIIMNTTWLYIRYDSPLIPERVRFRKQFQTVQTRHILSRCKFFRSNQKYQKVYTGGVKFNLLDIKEYLEDAR